MNRFDDVLERLRRVARGKSDEDPVEVVERSARFCEGCNKPECDFGCAYAPKRKPSKLIEVVKEKPVTHIAQKSTLSIHEPITTFDAPAPPPTISDAFRRAGQEIAGALDNMISTCEEARQEGLKLIEALYTHGKWHDEFLTDYVTVQTKAAAVMGAAWKEQIDELRRQRAALTQQTGGEGMSDTIITTITAEGGKS